MNNETTQEVAIIKQENIATIVQAAPQSYRDNRQSNNNCLRACQSLLDEIQTNGMTDELDQKAAVYIDKAKRTVKVMNERRSPVTKLFDQIRTEFTVLENSIDPSKLDTVPFRLQQLRNAYAAKKREEEEARRKAEEEKRLAEQARATYRTACSEDATKAFNSLLTQAINELTQLRADVTLDNYQATYDTVEAYNTALPSEWRPQANVRLPYNITPEECRSIHSSVLYALMPQFEQTYRREVSAIRGDILDQLPSKKVELERMAQASAAEAAKIKAEMAAREAAEAARLEKERLEKEATEKQKTEMEKSKVEMAGFFDSAAAQAYTPKAKVTKRISISSTDAIFPILSLWWQNEGSKLSLDDLRKIFKKQITYCEKTANKDGVFIQANGLEYVDEVKAK